MLRDRPPASHNQLMAEKPDQTKAIAYIETNGDIVEQARLRYLLEQRPPPAAALRQLYNAQQPDGGWSPFWSPPPVFAYRRHGNWAWALKSWRSPTRCAS
jgi:hypothetical protein